MDRTGRGVRSALGVQEAAASTLAGGEAAGLAAQCHRPFRARAARIRRAGSVSRGRSIHALPPALSRSHRPPADSGGGRCLRRRRLAGGLRKARRSPAGLAALRRTLGASLAGSRPLRRHQWLRKRSPAQHLAVSRLGDQGAERWPALRRVYHRAGGRRPAAEGHPGAARRHRLQSQSHAQRGRRHRSAGVSLPRDGRSREHRGHHLAGPHRGLRAMSHPQVRSHPASGVLRGHGLAQ